MEIRKTLRYCLARVDVATGRARRGFAAKRPRELIGVAAKRRSAHRALERNVRAAQASRVTMVFIAGHVTVLRVVRDLEFRTSTKITLSLAGSLHPGRSAAATMWSAIIEQAGEGGELLVAVGGITLLECARWSTFVGAAQHGSSIDLGGAKTANKDGHRRNCRKDP